MLIADIENRMNSYTMHQGNTEATLIDAIRRRFGPEVERGVVPKSMTLDDSLIDDLDAYPLTVELRHERREELATWRTNAHSVRPDGTIKPERGAIDAVIGASTDDTIPVVSGEEGTTKTIQAKYVIGSEGAHSWVRRQLGFQMVGSSSKAVWGVIDVVLNTNFPEYVLSSPPSTSMSCRQELINLQYLASADTAPFSLSRELSSACRAKTA